MDTFEKKYNEALERAKEWITEREQVICPREIVESIFPELRESEDERIIEEIKFAVMQMPTERQDTKNRCLTWLEKQKEQKPAEKQDYSGLNDLERAIHRGFLSAGVENVPVTIIKETANECLAQMKPAEWSEEDADMLNCCISSIEEAKENRYAYKETDGDTSYDREIDWLKSLRPSWKPSEEQMKALDKAIPVCAGIAGKDEISPLISLYEQLKKLI